MKRKLLGCVAALMLAAGLAQAQPFGPPPFPPPYPYPPPPPPPWMQYPPPRPYYPPPPPYPYAYGPMAPRYPYPPYAAPAPASAEPARTAEPPVAAAPKEAPAAAAVAGPAVADLVEQERGPCLRYWLTPEYLLWVANPGHTPPLVTTGPPGTPFAGSLGVPGTTTLFGGNINYPALSGLRLSLGGWIDPERKFAVEAQGFVLEQGVVNYSNAANLAGSPVLAVPYFNVSTGAPGQFTISNPNGPQGLFPGLATLGNVFVTSTSLLYGGEFNGYYNLFRTRGLSVDALGGFRYLGLQEALTMNTTGNIPFLGVTDTTSDRFATTNNFFGGQIGLKGTYQWKSLFVSGVIKCAVGVNNESVNVAGNTTIAGAGATSGTFAGGVLTQPSNIGQQIKNSFGVVPQAQLKIGYECTSYMRLFVGYDFLFWEGVARPGDQIDTNINPTQSHAAGGTGVLVGPTNPAPMFNRTNYFVQGFSAGIEFRY